MVCTTLGTIIGLEDYMVWPTSCDYYFYLKIGIALWLIITWLIMKGDEEKQPRADFISAAAVSSLAILVIMGFGTLVTNSADIPMIQVDILMYFLALAIPLILLWIFKR